MLPPEQVSAMLNQSKQQLVAQFPYLANNPQFQQELSDSFANFANRGLQRGADYNEVYNQTVAPTLAKWQAKGGQDMAKLTESQELTALDIAKRTGSPTAAVQAFPQLISPTSKFRAEWVGRINKADESSAQAKFDQAKNEKKLAVVANTGLTDDQRNQALAAIDALKPTLAGPPGAMGGTPLGAGLEKTNVLPQPTLQPQGYPVASPMGTSGYVNPNPALNPKPQIFIGKPTPEQAAALLQQWNSRSTGLPAGAPAPAAPAAALTPKLQIDPSMMLPPIVNAQPPLTLNLAGAPATAQSTAQPQQSDIDYLLKHPELAAQFNARFGDGAANQFLR